MSAEVISLECVQAVKGSGACRTVSWSRVSCECTFDKVSANMQLAFRPEDIITSFFSFFIPAACLSYVCSLKRAVKYITCKCDMICSLKPPPPSGKRVKKPTESFSEKNVIN